MEPIYWQCWFSEGEVVTLGVPAALRSHCRGLSLTWVWALFDLVARFSICREQEEGNILESFYANIH